MDDVSSHVRASPTRESGSCVYVRNQGKTILIKEDVSDNCMSPYFNQHDAHGNELLSEINDEGTTQNNSNGFHPAELQKKGAMLKLKRLKNSLLNMLKLRYKEICVLLVILISLLTAINNGHLATRKAAKPVKFFDSSGSLVTDFEYGQLSDASVLASNHEVTVTMYYAPWDLDSQLFRREYELVAEHFDGQVNFVAVNCWWPDGECSKKFSIKRFPVINAFLLSYGDVEYRGPLVASYVIPFLDNILDPVTTINGDGDLLELRSKHDAVAVGYFDFHESSVPSGYDNFMSAAIKSLTVDPWRRVQYSIVTSRKVAFKLYMDKPSMIAIYFWNSTGRMMGLDYKPEFIAKWVYDSTNASPTLVQWLTPSGVKSNALSSILSQGPTLVLFTPRSLILGISPFFETLRESVMDYLNCDNSVHIKSLIHRSILRRVAMEEILMELDEKCHELRDLTAASKLPFAGSSDSCCYSQSIRWKPPIRSGHKKCFCTVCIQMTKSKCPGGCKSFNCLNTASRFLATFDPISFVNSSTNYCNQIKTRFQPRYMPYYSIDVACTGLEPDSDISDFSSGLNPSTKSFNFVQTSRDDRITRMINSFESGYCSRLQLGLNYSDLNFPETGEGTGGYSQLWRKDFTGLACRTNRTLSFVALDSVLFPTFAEHLGIDVLNATHSTVAVIIEEPHENVYLLNNNYTSGTSLSKRQIYEFIKNYSANLLPRFERSQAISSSPECSRTSGDSICVPEVTSKSFSKIVLNPKVDVILMYYTPWCGFCSSVAHVYLSVAHLFRQIDSLVFARINVGQNDLPFEYTVDRIPSLIFFPSRKKSSSILFPPKQLVSEENLVEFIIENSSPCVRKMILSLACEGKCLQENIFSTSSHIRKLNRLIKFTKYSISEINHECIRKPNSLAKRKIGLRLLGRLKAHLIRLKIEQECESNYLTHLIRKRTATPVNNPNKMKKIRSIFLRTGIKDRVIVKGNVKKQQRTRKDEL